MQKGIRNRVEVVDNNQREPQFEAPAVVPETKVTASDPVRCPHCGKGETRVTKTMGGYRYRKCVRGCGRDFSTREKPTGPK
jgi:hypothetical protein